MVHHLSTDTAKQEKILGHVWAKFGNLTKKDGIRRQRDMTTIKRLMAYRSENAELNVPAHAPMLTM
jgi:hypothetical protein